MARRVKVLDDGAWKATPAAAIFLGRRYRQPRRQVGKGRRADRIPAGLLGLDREQPTAPVEYIPLSKGLIRGDAGISLRYKRPVAEVIGRRIVNSFILAALAFLFPSRSACILGLIAGLNEGKPIDRIISIGGLITAGSPDFATGILLIMVFAMWLKVSARSGRLHHPISAAVKDPQTADPAGADRQPGRNRLRPAHHPRQRGRSDEQRLRPHCHPQGLALPAGGDAPRAAKLR